ncbi:hypothetical protein BG57_15755 [Caballeronia grimmiae]|uniref:Uncharacterized protein n=1 Tax=Caballeronia grimmiae TaxID=1071679 RepID=A0A069NN28_9BURK|nr:hypothetical protein BG57_15755 [Caballeronia grimmiae]
MAMIAMRERNAQARRRRESRRHAVHDIDRDPRIAQGGDLFACAAKQQRVAALCAHHVQPLSRITQHEALNERLRRGLAAAALADANHASLRRERHDVRVGEVVDEQDIGGGERFRGADRQQVEIAGACTEKGDFSGGHRRVVFACIGRRFDPANTQSVRSCRARGTPLS